MNLFGTILVICVLGFLAVYGFSGGVRNSRLTVAHRMAQAFFLLVTFAIMAAVGWLYISGEH